MLCCALCACTWNRHSDLCQNKNCPRSVRGWREAEALRRRERADSPDFVEQTLRFDFACGGAA